MFVVQFGHASMAPKILAGHFWLRIANKTAPPKKIWLGRLLTSSRHQIAKVIAASHSHRLRSGYDPTTGFRSTTTIVPLWLPPWGGLVNNPDQRSQLVLLIVAPPESHQLTTPSLFALFWQGPVITSGVHE
jgi:hypothetical protein